jgi:phospholipase C
MQFDPNSILNMLAWRFGFEPLGVRGDSNNIAHALDFSAAPKFDTPSFDVAPGPFGGLCLPLATLLDIAGIPLPVPLPDIPVLPLPLQIKTPPIPGFDVPLQRLVEHTQELESLRELGRRFGF